MLIENRSFSTSGDRVVLKSGYNKYGWRVGRPTGNVIMRNCSGKHGHGGVVEKVDLPTNCTFLTAVPSMFAGWDGHTVDASGFRWDGRWKIAAMSRRPVRCGKAEWSASGDCC